MNNTRQATEIQLPHKTTLGKLMRFQKPV